MTKESVTNSTSPEELIAAASQGGNDRLGRLLAIYRNYLRLLARVEIGGRLQAKIDASDLVQDTMLEAHKNFPQFRGVTEAEFTAWLRQIMAGILCGLLRKYFGTQKRDIRLERTLCENLDNSSMLLGKGLIDLHSSPSQQAARREQAVLLADALENMPNDYREVLVLRHVEGLTFPDIARRMERTQDSVEKLWVRGLARLRKEMEAFR
jgi:RNA polymerase sigma-70 factor, ECF subfamily